jgi:hypothetical protein
VLDARAARPKIPYFSRQTAQVMLLGVSIVASPRHDP